MSNQYHIERHPWQPFIPENSKILFLGTFPPKSDKWGMDFYYPNKINDFWRIMGMILHNDYNFFYDSSNNCFDKELIIKSTTDNGIALGDVGMEVIRLKNNASDKFLKIVTPINLLDILEKAPKCNIIVSTGQKAAEIISRLTQTNIPPMGNFTTINYSTDRLIKIYRMPSTSRAYPLSLDKKTEFYNNLFLSIGIL